MMTPRLCWLVVTACWLSGHTFAQVPPYFSAAKYDFQLTLGLLNDTFSGIAQVTLQTNGETDIREKDFVLNGVGLIPAGAVIVYPNRREVIVNSNDIKVLSSEESITIHGKEFLKKNQTYTVTLYYTGNLDTSGGIFASNLNNKIYYGTKLYPTHGGRVFPCLDQPGNLAQISLAVTVLKTKDSTPQVISGLNANGKTDGANSVTYHFTSQTPLPLSSLFFVAGEYKNVAGTNKAAVWVPSSLASLDISTIASALEVDLVLQLQKTTNSLFPDVQLAAVVVPGLPTPTDSGLALAAVSLQQAQEILSQGGKKEQAIETLRSIYRGLFVGLMPPSKWRDFWIPETISLYLAEKTYTQIKGMEVWNNTNLGLVVDALKESWSQDSTPVQPEFANSSEVVTYLRSPALKKGAAILAMLGGILQDGVENEVFNNIALDYFGNSISTEEFLESYADYTNLEHNNFPGNKTLVEVLKPWLTKPGYPAVNIGRKETDIVAGESVFRAQGADIEWTIPINYRLLGNPSSNDQCYNSDCTNWIVPTKNADFKLASGVDNKTAISLNIRGTGLYRTLYDEKDIKLLGNVFHDSIDTLNSQARATIISDLFAFVEAGQLKHSLVLDLLQYLGNEGSLEPFAVAIRGLEQLRSLVFFKDNDLTQQFNNFAGDLLRSSYLTMGLPLNEQNLMMRMFSSMVAKKICDYDDDKCRLDAIAAYDANIKKGNEEKIVNKDIIPVLYCNKLRYSNISHFSSYLKNYTSNSPVDKKRNVFSYLACPEDNATINWYLSSFMLENSTFKPDDIVIAFEELAARLEPLDLCFSFLSSNWNSLHNLTDEQKAKLIATLGNYGSSDLHINTLKNFPASESAVVKSAISNALKKTQDRQAFVNTNYYDIQYGLYGFNPVTPTPGPGPNPSPGPDPSPTPSPSPTPKPSSAPAMSTVMTVLLPTTVLALLAIH